MSANSQKKLKDPDSTLDFGFDWEDWLDDVTDTIAASTWTVPAGLTKDSDTFDDTTTTIWLSGGTAGTWYTCVNHITTAAGREDDRSLYIKVVDR